MVIRALHFLLLPIAATFGWYFGKKESGHFATQATHQLRRDYFQGLSYIINEQPDKAVDVFIKLSEVDSDTAEVHLALGHLFRRQGEVDRAIRIHQNLLARPELDKHYHQRALFALGQDFLRAGVLDRAEQIFLQLTESLESANEEKQQSFRFLLRIYQQEKEWRKAIEVTKKLTSETGTIVDPLVAQFYCELAEQEAHNGRMVEALQHLHQAINADPNCVRANLIAGQIAYETKHYAEAVQHYKQVKLQDIQFIMETIPALCQCYRELREEEILIEYLQECLQSFPNLALVLTVAEYLQRQKGDQAAIDLISQHVQSNPALRSLKQWVSLCLTSSADVAEKFKLLQTGLQQLLANKSVYRCGHCGFSTKILFWCCPGCHHWSTTRPLQNSIGAI